MVHIDSRLLCQPVHTVAGPGNVVLLDPSYYGFEGCVCDDGYVMTTTTNPAGRITSLICSLPAVGDNRGRGGGGRWGGRHASGKFRSPDT